MYNFDDLSVEDNKILHDFEVKFSSRAKFQITIPSLISKWERFINLIEKGYDLSIYEYMNDISARDLIEDVLENSTETIREWLSQHIFPLDQRYIKLTKRKTHPLLTGKKSAWWYRIPIKATGEMANDLENLDLK
jgi:hypothetical protein